MERGDFENSSTFNLVDALLYHSNSIVTKTIIATKDCFIKVLVFDYGKVQSYVASPVTRFIHIIEGKAEVVINENSTFLQSGDSIIIPAHTSSSIEANHKFKMICCTIKSE
ncbi:cupin domain-containing protein [Flavobacteriaceae bacterium M23B6Z8]